MFWIPVNVSFFSGCNRQSAEDVIAEQAKQKEDDPFANLSKKEKKKKKKMVIYYLFSCDSLFIYPGKVMRSHARPVKIVVPQLSLNKDIVSLMLFFLCSLRKKDFDAMQISYILNIKCCFL